jgi:hypothetical protein
MGEVNWGKNMKRGMRKMGKICKERGKRGIIKRKRQLTGKNHVTGFFF